MQSQGLFLVSTELIQTQEQFEILGAFSDLGFV